MEKFVIEGGYPLNGTVIPSGNKNEALAILPATLMTDEEIILKNVPKIGDIETTLQILVDLGVEIEDKGDHTLSIRAREIRKTELDFALSRKIRSSFLFGGALLARCGRATLPPPGGDLIGRRRVETHLMALEALGADITVDRGFEMKTDGLRGEEIFLDEASVTATENAILAATLAEGKTMIENAATEPHVQNLCRYLNKLGAKISGIGSNLLHIDGVKRLHGGEHEIGPDYIEIGSFIALAAITGGEIVIKRVVPEHLKMIRLVFRRLGIEFDIQGRDVIVHKGQSLKVTSDLHGIIPKIDDAPWPGFPTDLISIATVVATQAEGTVLMFEKMFESRMFWLDRLIEMGARIVLCDPHRAVVVGPSKLHGEELASPDIRAGIALLLAALCAEGRSVIHNITQIDRGHERIDEKLKALGARIERVAVTPT